MGLLNKIKLIFAGRQEEKETIVREIITLEELPYKLESKINELTALKKQLKEHISKRISFFETEINEKIVSLEKIDISNRKEHDRIKIIVKDNLDIYISHLKRTLNNIKEADKEGVDEYIARLFRILNEFNKASSKPFEKATILIGEELSSTRMIIISFSQDINKIIEDNKFIFDKGGLCNSISNLLSGSKRLTSLHTEIENKLLEMKTSLEDAEKERDILKDKLLRIKEGDDFKKDNQDKTDYRKRADYLENEIQAIKRGLDFKLLLKKFHHDNKMDKLIRRYMDDFKDALINDKELRIIGAIEDNNTIGLLNLKEIQDTIISLTPLSPSKIDMEIASLEEEIKEKSRHIIGLENNIKNELKMGEKLSMKLQELNLDVMENSKLLFE